MASAHHNTISNRTLSRNGGLSSILNPISGRASPIAQAALVIAAASALAACGSEREGTLESVTQEAKAVTQESRVAEALDTVIDEQALEGLARGAINGAVNDAIADVLPAEEMATVRAIVDEEAIARSVEERFGRAGDAAPESTER